MSVTLYVLAEEGPEGGPDCFVRGVFDDASTADLARDSLDRPDFLILPFELNELAEVPWAQGS